MAKTDYKIKEVSKKQAGTILLKYHYLKDISKGFKSGYNYGIFKDNILLGVIIFTGFPVPELSKGMLGLERNQQEGLFELSRLCLEPEIQKEEHNLASWFVSRAIRQLRKGTQVKVILSYADADFHNGTVYKACNFDYYGLSAPKKDFWIEQPDGTYKKHSRGKTKGVKGEWRPRSRKHRYLIVFDKKLNVRWEKLN
jgi:hypothetical protein|tara:strand:+ start:619 stop:1209 length:591 start_codon:yes stop_codon:yes gene_type:complete